MFAQRDARSGGQRKYVVGPETVVTSSGAGVIVFELSERQDIKSAQRNEGEESPMV